jgi:iron(III) transport system permease protein
MAIKLSQLRRNPFAIITGITFLFVIIFLYQFIPPLLQPPGPMWVLLQTYWFPEVLIQTFSLVAGTVLISLWIGVSLGYRMSFYRVKWARLWDILLVLPLAMPAYLLAYIYVDLTSSSFFQTRFVITNLFGAIILFSLTLYPYIYLATRSFLSKQPQTMYASAQSLGANQRRIFWQIILPLLRPVLVGSSVLVIMEVLNDYGLVQYFGLRVYATTIFQSWFNGNDLNTAVRFSVQLIAFILVILWIESRLRQSFKYSYTTTQIKPLMKRELTGNSKFAFYTVAILVLSFALIIPIGQLISWLPSVPLSIYGSAFIDGTISSIVMAFYPTMIILVIALAVINFQRLFPKPWKKTIARILTIGYSLPGAVIAVGMILMVIPFDRWITETFGLDHLLISGSLLLLTFALVLRFLAVASHLIEGTYHKIGMKYTNASYALGRKHLKTLFAVDLPLISHGVIAAGLIVMVDLFKELPLTLILRPFNLQTLATYLFQFAGDEQINLASPMALMLVLLTGLAVAFASDMMLKVNTYES